MSKHFNAGLCLSEVLVSLAMLAIAILTIAESEVFILRTENNNLNPVLALEQSKPQKRKIPLDPSEKERKRIKK